MTAISLGLPALPRPVGAPSMAGRPESADLIDRFGRVARDLRVSITEKCTLRCTYCMPAEGLPLIPRDDLLSSQEIARLVGLAWRDLGVREVRFTGGEPLVRRDLDEIIRLSAEAAPGIGIAMTTNGIGLDKRLPGLLAAGLERVNVSLDTINREHFARLTRRDRLESVVAGIRAAHAAGIAPLKINAVLLRETLEGATDLLAWAIENDCQLRFIEQMPLDADALWRRENLLDAEELLAVLGERFTLTPLERDDLSSPAEEWLVDGGPHTVGIIASVTRPFCEACDRTRLTAEGTVRSCLFGDDEIDLRALLRGGASDAEIGDAWRGAMWNKQAGHGINADGFAPPVRSMGAIGG
ncbi:GTP 3',8-cyclase MoaA [Amnibacterium flavum]|uniref:GTP 3',8-cyclase n=1 Tax=Amnibacterium flavum TaxID=2173173 RepID=A0A2V1HTX2_9MICO|nr:GTP 3',8-cyclase MoaA [Amnibacterium flavum]PVZ96055.1 GTP 3',8-cyclase MoaA [Amnibacterium flavum]